jgi:hypothetical protein
MRAGVDQYRVAVRRRIQDKRRRCRAPAPGVIDDIDLSPEALRERPRQRARHDVRAAAGAERLDQAHRSPQLSPITAERNLRRRIAEPIATTGTHASVLGAPAEALAWGCRSEG